LNSVYTFCVQTGSLDSSVCLVTDRQGRSFQCHSTNTPDSAGHSGRGQLTSYYLLALLQRITKIVVILL